MIRSILSVIVAYVAMAVLIFVSFTVAMLVLGTERTYQPGTYDVSGLWVIVSCTLNVLIGIAGGLVCVMIAKRGSKAPVALMVVMLVLGFAMAAMSGGREDPGPRVGEVSPMEAAAKSKAPGWSYWVTPVLGVIGVGIGTRLAGKPRTKAPADA